MKSRILYVGNLRDGGNGVDRVAMLQSCGFEVEGFDTLPCRQGGSRLIRSMTARYQLGPQVTMLNRDLWTRAERGGYDAVLIDKGTVVKRDTLRALKRGAAKGVAMHFTPDAAFVDNRSREFFRAIPDYDLLVTTKPFEVDAYRRAGARELMLIEQGYGLRIDAALAKGVPDHLQSEVVFVGHCQPHYMQMLRVAAEAAPLAIWGPGWPEKVRRHPWLRDVVRGPALFGPDYARALAGAKIAIGLLSKRIPETTTTRTFEIPAMGTMLLAERTGDHLRLFQEGREAAFFEGPEELTSQLQRYLGDEEARKAIARAGQEKCHSAGYSISQQFNPIIEWLRRAVGSPPQKKGLQS